MHTAEFLKGKNEHHTTLETREARRQLQPSSPNVHLLPAARFMTGDMLDALCFVVATVLAKIIISDYYHDQMLV